MFDRRRVTNLLLAAALVLLAACTPGGGSSAPPTRLVLMTHDSFLVSDGIIEAFEQAHGVDVEVLTAGDAGEMVNKAILTKGAPLADVLYGVDNTFLSRALDAGIFDPYASAALANVPEALKTDTAGLVTPIDYGDVCLNYDKSAFSGDQSPPADLSALTDPAYAHELVVENPATSSPGLAFLLATIGRFGETGSFTWQDYWRALTANDVLVVDDWDSAYYSSFSGGSGAGDRPIVVSYATSPVAEVVFADPPVTEAPTAVVTDGCFRQVEYAAVLHGTKAPQLADEFIDFMLSSEFQQDIPLNMFVFPANSAATVPAVFLEHAAQVAAPVELDAALIAANRDRWVQEWTDVVLH
jgi:thiamine transport system substrate-binding protein